MNTRKEKLILSVLIAIILAPGPALIRAQDSALAWIPANTAFTVTSSPITVLKSNANQIFIGLAGQGDTRIKCAFYLTGLQRGTTLALDNPDGLPLDYTLGPNYPNPFNPVTTIQFDLPISTSVYVVVYDLLGREVIQLVDGYHEAGCCQVLWRGADANGREIPAGIYIARLTTPEFVKSIKMVLLK